MVCHWKVVICIRGNKGEIRSQHSTKSDRLRAVLLYALTLHPRSSWRCVINVLYRAGLHKVAERIQDEIQCW